MVRRTVLAFLQGLFEHADFGCFHWSEILEETEIVITDESPIKLDVVGERPAITVLRAPIQWGKTSLDQMRSIDAKTNGRTHMDLLSGHLSINCCSKNELESEYISWIVANHMWMLRRLMIKNTYIHDIGQGVGIGSVSPAGALVQGSSEGEWHSTPVNVPFYLQNNFSISPVNQTLLNQIGISLGVRAGANTGVTPVRDSTPEASGSLNPPKFRGRPMREIAFTQNLDVKE
jgi:hypothetical protein